MKFGYILFAIAIFLYPIGQLFEKKGMMEVGVISNLPSLFSLNTLLKIITNWNVLAGIGCSALGLVLWLIILSNFEVSYVYPMLGGMCYIVLTLLAHFVLGESVSITRWFGILIIAIGCFLVNL